MDWWLSIKGALTLAAVLLALVLLVVSKRAWRILGWRRSLVKELGELEQEAAVATGLQRQALEAVLAQCHRIWRTPLPRLEELTDLPGYIRHLARFYNPAGERPELRITMGRLLAAAGQSAERLELILDRPGFQALRRVRIRHLRHYYLWYRRLSRYRPVRWLGRHRRVVVRISRLRLLILPDPFSWLFFLSGRLTTLVLTRCLLLDVYLFSGRLAVQVFDLERSEFAYGLNKDELEKALSDLESLGALEPRPTDPRLLQIRRRLVGFSATVLSTPGLKAWKQAVREAAEVTARKHFPTAERPLEEAALGPLLERSRMWLKSLADAERLPLVKRLYRIPFQSLYSLRALPQGLPFGELQSLAKNSWGLYRMTKWPVRLYRWVRRTSGARVAIDVGWLVARKTLANFICRYSFDIACRELEMLYSQSRGLAGGPRPQPLEDADIGSGDQSRSERPS